jgi:hypothetical protein
LTFDEDQILSEMNNFLKKDELQMLKEEDEEIEKPE